MLSGCAPHTISDGALYILTPVLSFLFLPVPGSNTVPAKRWTIARSRRQRPGRRQACGEQRGEGRQAVDAGCLTDSVLLTCSLPVRMKEGRDRDVATAALPTPLLLTHALIRDQKVQMHTRLTDYFTHVIVILVIGPADGTGRGSRCSGCSSLVRGHPQFVRQRESFRESRAGLQQAGLLIPQASQSGPTAGHNRLTGTAVTAEAAAAVTCLFPLKLMMLLLIVCWEERCRWTGVSWDNSSGSGSRPCHSQRWQGIRSEA